MSSPDCSCRPQTEALQAKRDAFSRQFADDGALMKSIASKYPDGTTSADLRDFEILSTGKPPFRAGSRSDDLDFDGMVKEAGYRLFGKSTRWPPARQCEPPGVRQRADADCGLGSKFRQDIV